METIQSLIQDINEGKEKLDEMMGVKDSEYGTCQRCGEECHDQLNVCGDCMTPGN